MKRCSDQAADTADTTGDPAEKHIAREQIANAPIVDVVISAAWDTLREELADRLSEEELGQLMLAVTKEAHRRAQAQVRGFYRPNPESLPERRTALRKAVRPVTNIDHRLKATIRAANRQLSKLGIEPISERVSPHSLRRTYASMRAALRDDPVYIAEQLGHENPEFTFRVYQRAAKRRERLSGKLLSQFDRGLQWAEIGRIAALPSAQVEEVNWPHSPNPLGQAENTHSGR
jgi:hypothetical protein